MSNVPKIQPNNKKQSHENNFQFVPYKRFVIISHKFKNSQLNGTLGKTNLVKAISFGVSFLIRRFLSHPTFNISFQFGTNDVSSNWCWIYNWVHANVRPEISIHVDLWHFSNIIPSSIWVKTRSNEPQALLSISLAFLFSPK